MKLKNKRKRYFHNPLRPKITLRELEEMLTTYNQLCKRADEILKKYNPCNFKNGICLRGWHCCNDCEFLSRKKGCKEKSLACKLWLCDKARETSPKCAISLDELELVAKKSPFILLGYRTIKEDAIIHYEVVE